MLQHLVNLKSLKCNETISQSTDIVKCFCRNTFDSNQYSIKMIIIERSVYSCFKARVSRFFKGLIIKIVHQY